MKVTINKDQKLYVIPCGDGYTCWGFQNAWDEVQELVRLLKDPRGAPPLEFFGTLKLYELAKQLQRKYAESPLSKETWFEPRTCAEVRNVLEDCRKQRHLVRIWLGDAQSGGAWLEEYETIGRVCRSTGPMRIPILVAKGADDGGAILTASIVRIRAELGRKDLYRHPEFHLPALKIRPLEHKLPFGITEDGVLYSRHRTRKEAEDLVAWFEGNDSKK